MGFEIMNLTVPDVGLREGCFDDGLLRGTMRHGKPSATAILVDGTAAGAVSRVPAVGEARANLHVGARAEKTTLSRREQNICAAIGPALRERGLIFVGIDVIGDFLTEINVTSPTGIMEINQLDVTRLDALVWNAIEGRIVARKG